MRKSSCLEVNADALGLEVGALDQHVGGVGADLAVLPAHDSGQGDGLGFVRDEEHAAVEPAFLAVEGHELFAFGGAAHDDGRPGAGAGPGQEAAIEGMQRLADLEHDVIGDIHHVAEAADANLFEGLLEPIRAGGDLDAADDAGGVARAESGSARRTATRFRLSAPARRRAGPWGLGVRGRAGAGGCRSGR